MTSPWRPPESPWPYLAVGGVALAVLVGRAAWGQEPAAVEPAGDVWQAVGVGVGVIVTAAAAGVAAWLRSDPDRRARAADPAPVPVLSAAETRAMITEAVERARGEATGQHERVRGDMRRLEARIEQVDARLTTDQHAGAERREHLAREIGQIMAGIEHLRRTVERE